LVDNSNVLSPGQQSNGGFTVFGKLVGDADMNVIQKLSDLNSLTNPGLAIHNFTSPFNSIPLRNYSGTHFPSDATASNFDLVQDVQVASRPESLTSSVVANSTPNLVSTSLQNNRLTLNYAAGQTGTATITVRAIDMFGASVDSSFDVVVANNAPP